MDRTGGDAAEPTTLVGRGAEAAEARRLLGSSRVLTLTGPGGVGKTRLARRVRSDVSRAYADGTHVVALADLRDPGLLATTVAQAMGRSDAAGPTTLETLVAYLGQRHTLIVLDNCEHLVDEVAELVHAVVARAPRVTVLATSRQSLGVPGEQLFVVPPLPVPSADEEPARLADSDSVRLFVDRARAVVPHLDLEDADQLRDVATLCRRLDGLPLAIELAAARMRVLSARQISERLDHGLALLTGGARTAPERQQTMRAAIDGSHESCSELERLVWARASVFAGSFDLEAAESVCGAPPARTEDVVLALDGLVDKSILLRSARRDGIRFRLLEPLREYGHEVLAASGEATQVARRHRDFYEEMTAQADEAWFGPDQALWMRRLTAEQANLRAALDWSISVERDAERSLALAIHVAEPLCTGGSPGEARRWVERALAISPPDLPGRARALGIAGYAAIFHADIPLGLSLADEAERLGDPESAPYVAHLRAFAAVLKPEPGSAEARRAVDGFAAAGDQRRTLHPMFLLGLLQGIEGDPEGGRQTLARMVELCAPAGDTSYAAMAHFGRAVLEMAFFDDPDAAEGAAREAVRIDSVIESNLGLAYHLDALAWVASRQGHHQRAATVFGAADARWTEAGAAPDVAIAILHERFAALTREALGDVAYERLHAAGRAMPVAEAVAFALDTHTDTDTACTVETPLTPRETEIAELVAEGLTNRAIADRLVIALRTVDTHVQNILTKLDLRNRTQLAGWVSGRRGAPTRFG